MYDLVVIGGGPAGYVGAIKASQLGLKVACVEKRGSLGGTCLNVGCIPSKALLESSHIYEKAQHSQHHGVIAEVRLDFDRLMQNKGEVVSALTKGIEGLFAKNKVEYIKGHAIVMGKGEVAVKVEGGTPLALQTKNILIATGSTHIDIPNVEVDEETILSSTGALSLTSVPKSLIVIGGGVIGLELGSVYKRLGSEVEVVEFLDFITPSNDEEVRKALQKSLEKQGIKFRLGTKVVKAEKTANGVELTVEKGGTQEKLIAEKVLVAVGRKPFTSNLGLNEAGVKLNERGRIITDSHFKTSVDGVYAVGDVIEGAMLAHKAEEEAVAAVENMVGQHGHIDYDCIPSVIYTHPEVACVGKNEQQLKQDGVEYKVGKFPFMANSRARAICDTEGFVKILACKKTDLVLGVHIIGPQAGTMIAECVVAMTYKAASEDIARICHSHPDLNEAIKEAAMAAAFGKAIHI
jgi:dihydrolipoamide dehydrogenase